MVVKTAMERQRNKMRRRPNLVVNVIPPSGDDFSSIGSIKTDQHNITEEYAVSDGPHSETDERKFKI